MTDAHRAAAAARAGSDDDYGGGDPNPRDRRALAEYLTALGDVGRAHDAEGLYLVVSHSGREYLVDDWTGACECPDHRYRNVRCKHARRVEFATGKRAIPAEIEGVDEQLGDHVEGTPRVAVTDGGTLGADGEGAGDEGAGDKIRPDDCACWDPDGALPCWPCYRDGFAGPNPDAAADE